MGKTKRYRGIAACLVLALLVMPLSYSGANAAGTGKPSRWAGEAVSGAAAFGLVPPAFQNRYTQPATRAEFCAIAVSFYEDIIGAEIVQRRKFSDTNDVNVHKMGGLNIVSGTGGNKFSPSGLITREQSAVIFAHMMKSLKLHLDAKRPSFSDRADISDWALAAVGQMQASGIMAGTGNNRFSPKVTYSIEQVIVVLVKIHNLDAGAIKAETALIQDYSQKMLALVNAERAKAGLPAVTGDPTLQAAAATRSAELEQSFSHTRPDGRGCFTVLEDLGVTGRASGENLAIGYTTPERAVRALMASASHKKTILNARYKKLGVGVYIDSGGGFHWAQMFTD